MKHSVTMKIHLGVHWTEPRLIFPHGSEELSKVPLDLQFLDYLWLPDIDIYNIKAIQEFSVLKRLAGIIVNIFYLQ